MAHALVRHVSSRNPAKLRVNKRDQLLEGRIVALTPGEKEAGHLNGRDSARILL
jgi:hypothetical protein